MTIGIIDKSSEPKKIIVVGPVERFFRGENVDISRPPWPVFDVQGSAIVLKDFVMVSSGVYIHTHTHQFHDANWRELPEVHYDKPTIIDRYAFLGVNAQIMNTCKHVGVSSVVAAGSIVTKDIPDFEIWAGNPAAKIGDVKR